MPVATKTGLKDSETKIPAKRHNIQTGNCAPSILITGLHPKMKKAGQDLVKWSNRKFVAFRFRSPTVLLAKMHKCAAQRRARNLQ
jgi:hypothetical protein